MNKVLMIAYYFPPIASVGVFRILKFAKYLPRFGWKPVILTVRNPDPFMVKLDPHYADDRLRGVKVFRSYSVPLGWIHKIRRLGISDKWFMVPDVFIGWLPSAVSLGKKIVAKERIDVIYASCPPVSSLILGALLKKMTKKPLVLDYRDPWTGHPSTLYPTRAERFWRKMEERILKSCDVVITVGKRQREDMLKVFPFLEEADVHVIPNGFDPKDFLGVKPQKFDKFTIVNTGAIYGARTNLFKIFLRALHGLLESEKVPDFQVVHIGSSTPPAERNLTKLIQELNLTNYVHRLGQKSHREALQFALGADVLLLMPFSSMNVPAKTFEYLAAGKFIFNVSDPASESARIIDEAKAGITVKPEIMSLQKSLHEVFNLKDYKLKKNMDVLNRFTRITLTEKLVSVFDLILKE